MNTVVDYGNVMHQLADDVAVRNAHAEIEDAIQAGGRLVMLSTVTGPVHVLVTCSIPITIRSPDPGRKRRGLLV